MGDPTENYNLCLRTYRKYVYLLAEGFSEGEALAILTAELEEAQ